MKVLLVGNYESDLQDSMQRFATFMAKGLTKAGHQVQTVRPRDVFGRIHRSSRGVGKWLGYVDKFGVFPQILRSTIKWADVVHICDQANSVYTKYIRCFPHVVTCHDLLGVRSALGEISQNRTGWTGRQFQKLILNGLTEAQHIVCVSEATRKDLLRVGGIPENRVSRIYNSLPYPFSSMEKWEAQPRLRRLLVDPGQPFLLHVGGNQWYKNRLGVLRIFSCLRRLTAKQDLKLVMVGKPWTEEMRRFVADHGMTDVTIELTGTSDEDLRALYSTATLMLFPSLYEGFGWPIIEAQACGCPVITSSRSPMDEVGGNAAIYCEPEDPESAAVVVKRSLENVPGMRERSLLNAARFDTAVTIDSYLSLYEKVRTDVSWRRSISFNAQTDHLFDKYYFARPSFVDGSTEFQSLMAAGIDPGSLILEIGSGPTNPTTKFLATLGSVIGADVTSEIHTNTSLTEAHLFDGTHLPFPNERFDVCVSNWVIEHVRDPSAHFREVARILKPGGMYFLRTPNLWHYFTVGSKLLPFGVHLQIANKLRGLSDGSHDPYPKYYRANTLRRIRQLCGSSGLVPMELIAIEKEPSYGRLHPMLFYPMFLYERCVNSFRGFESFRASILGVLQKPCTTKN